MGGGDSNSGGQSLYLRQPSAEWPTIRNWFGKQEQQYGDFVGKDPILSRLYSGAADYFDKGPSPILKLMQGQAEGDLAGRGALSPELNRDVRNETLATAGSMGMGWSPGTLGTELLNREKYREAREDRARTYASGTEVLGQADIAQRFKIPQDVATGAAGIYGGLTNPILSYLNSAFTPTTVQQGAGDNKGGEVGQLAGTVISAAASAYSDERLKENIVDTGMKTPEGIPIKDFNYRGDARRFRGVIAQDVERIKPEAVITLPVTGHKLVDYAQIAAPFHELKE